MAARGIFDPEITAGPCRYPCSDWRHVHDESLPANLHVLQDCDPERLPPFRASDRSEVSE